MLLAKYSAKNIIDIKIAHIINDLKTKIGTLPSSQFSLYSSSKNARIAEMMWLKGREKLFKSCCRIILSKSLQNLNFCFRSLAWQMIMETLSATRHNPFELVKNIRCKTQKSFVWAPYVAILNEEFTHLTDNQCAIKTMTGSA